jgi:hypothetical protein
MEWNVLAEEAVLAKVAEALGERGIEAIIANNADEAKRKVLELIPNNSEVMAASSTTLDQIGITKELEGDRYVSLKKVFASLRDKKERDDARRKSISPQYGIGSVHAITEQGQIVVASASGSQLAFYVFGAANLVLVAGTQKIVKDLDEAFIRIKEYVLPLESERVKKAYGMPGSSINKMLIIEKEPILGRTKLILVKEKLGF